MTTVLTEPSTQTLNTSEIPEAYRPKLTTFNQYLVDGELKTWNGKMAEVYSTIRTENKKEKWYPPYWGLFPIWSLLQH